MRSPRRVFGGKTRKLFRFTKTRIFIDASRPHHRRPNGNRLSLSSTETTVSTTEPPKSPPVAVHRDVVNDATWNDDNDDELCDSICDGEETEVETQSALLLQLQCNPADDVTTNVFSPIVVAESQLPSTNKPGLSPSSASSSSSCHESGNASNIGHLFSGTIHVAEKNNEDGDEKERSALNIKRMHQEDHDYGQLPQEDEDSSVISFGDPAAFDCCDSDVSDRNDSQDSAETGNHTNNNDAKDSSKQMRSRKRKFGSQSQKQQSGTVRTRSSNSIWARSPRKTFSMPQPTNSAADNSTTQAQGRLSTCFGTPLTFDRRDDLKPQNGNPKQNKKVNKVKSDQEGEKTLNINRGDPHKASKMKQDDKRSQLDFGNDGESNKDWMELKDGSKSIQNVKFVRLGNANEFVEQPTSQTSLRKAREFFDRLDHETLTTEQDIAADDVPRSAAAGREYRTKRSLSLKEPGVAHIYQTHLDICREAGVSPLPLKAFWEQQRKNDSSTIDGEKSQNARKNFYDGFLDES